MASSSKKISLKLDVQTDGAGKIKALGIDADDLGKAIAFATREAKKAKSAFDKWGQTAIICNNISQTVNNLNNVIQQLSAANAVQEQAEARLAQAMQNTMGATDAQIQSIKELCSAQQQLGVIGDEVLLQGAQELAMHLQNTESLKGLIPIMNDVITQQYGIGASGENAAAVGKMLGKVMEGNTTALKRMGVTLTDAQESMLKYGDESERASVLAEVLEKRFGGMAEAAANTASGRMAQLNNTIGDIKESIGASLTKITPFIQILGQLGQAGAGVTTIYKGLSPVLVKLGSSANTGSVGVRILSMSIKGLLITTGVGVAILALTKIISALSGSADDASESMRILQEAEEAGQKAYADATKEINEQKDKLSALMTAHRDTSAAVSELNNTYGHIFGTYATAADWLDTLTKKQKDYATQMYLTAKNAEIVSRMGELQAKNMQLQRENDEIKERRGFETQEINGVERAYHGKNASRNAVLDAAQFNENSSKILKINNELAKLEKQYQNNIDAAEQLKRTLSEGSEGIEFNADLATSKVLGDRIKEINDTLATEYNSLTINSEAARKLIEERDKLKAQKDKLDANAGLSNSRSTGTHAATSPVNAEVEINDSSVEYAEKQIADIQSRIRKVDIFDHDAIEDLNRELDYWLEELQNRKITVGLEVAEVIEPKKSEASIKQAENDEYFAQGSLEDLRLSLANAKANAEQIKEDFYNGFIDGETAQRLIDEVNAQLEEIGLKPLDLHVDIDRQSILSSADEVEQKLQALKDRTREFTEMSSSIGGLASGFGQLGDAIGESTGKIIEFAASMTQGIAQLIPQIMTLIEAKKGEAIASSAASAAQAPWFMIPATIATIVGTIMGTFASIPKFADGGIAYGPTVGLFGEYAGASSNPEVVAPLDKLKNLVKTEETFSGRVEFEIDGRKLKGLLQKVERFDART